MRKKILLTTLALTGLIFTLHGAVLADEGAKHFDAPTTKEISCQDGGILYSFNAPDGSDYYRVYKKTGNSGWEVFCDTDKTSITDNNVTSGNNYSYTARCISQNKAMLSEYKDVASVMYLSQPQLGNTGNVADGQNLSWSSVNGAYKYRIYVKNNDSWNKVGESFTTNFVNRKVSSGTTYTYTVSAQDKDGKSVSSFNVEGKAGAFLSAPVITKAHNIVGKTEIIWNRVNGADLYKVYRRSGSSWECIATTSNTSYSDNLVSSGTTYVYTVRALGGNPRTISGYNGGKAITYLSSPVITGFDNSATGTKLTWKNVKGAKKYRIYVKSAGAWKRVGESSNSSFTYNNLKSGTKYTYTVSCENASATSVSGYSDNGWAFTFVAPPSISSITKANTGNTIKWNNVAGASKYALYRKTFGGSWSRVALGIAATSYNDTSAKRGVLYAYTLRCQDENGHLNSYYKNTDCYYYNGALANGKINVNGKTLNFVNGYVRSGFVKINGKTYYYNSQGVLVKSGIAGSAKEGYYYADKNGVIDFTYRNGVTIGGTNWIVENGRARKVSGNKDLTYFRALQLAHKITNNTMTQEQKLKTCFDYVKKAYTERNPRIPHYTGMDWVEVYANDMFVGGSGNCLSYAAAFAYLAKAIGYKDVYGCNSGGHGWAEIGGLIYDPEWSIHHDNSTYYAIPYYVNVGPDYKGAISPGYAWMHIKLS